MLSLLATKAKIHKAIKTRYWWSNMKKYITDYINECPHCQQNKRNRLALEGKLLPLPIPKKSWKHITIDFPTKLPETAQDHTRIMVVMDQLFKIAYFISTRDDANAPGTTCLFLDNIYKLHGMPDSVTSDRDDKFVSNF
jgi:hypothetical protein